MPLSYDFWINGLLGFNVRPSKDAPYERATAQFRKEQLDSTPTVGDQSLVGWWTRGQLSFHRGAGVKYYELISDDDAIENRFRTSLGVNPWTPGEVVLGPAYDRIALANILDVVPVSPPVAAESTGSNLVTNGAFETDVAGWSSLFSATAARSSTHAHGGTYAMRITWPTASALGTSEYTTVTGLVIGRSYRAVAWVYVPPGAPRVAMRQGFTYSAPTSTTGAFEQLTLNFLATATSHTLAFAPVDASTSGQQCWVDDVEVRLTPPGAAVSALLNDGTLQYANATAGQVFGSYTDEGAVSIASDGTTLFACTPSAIERQGAVTRYQYVTNPTFDAAGDTSFATAQGGISASFTGSSIDFTTVDATDGVRFEVPVATSATERINLVPNPSFETSAAGWSAFGGPGAGRAATPLGSGGYVYASTQGGTSDAIAVTAGLSYAAQAIVANAAGAGSDTISLKLLWSTGATSTVSSATVGESATMLGGVATAPVGAVSVQVSVQRATPASPGMAMDAVLLEQASEVLPYFDGAMSTLDGYTCSWEGVPHASRSIATPTVAADAPALCRVTTSVPVDVQVWDGASYVSTTETVAGTLKSFFVTSDGGVIKFQLMGTTGHFGATSVTELSVTSSLAESETPNPTDSRWSWSGTTDDSVQTRTVEADGLSVLWPAPEGGSWAGCWYAKGRLLAVDNAGRWYALAPTGGGVVETADSFWSSGWASGWSVAESPAAIYLARGNEVYRLTLDDEGLLPTISAAVIAAQLPVSESIASITCYLGWMVICTNRGVRAAIIQDGGALVYGARFIEGDFSRCTRIAVNGDLAYVTGISDDDNDSAVYAVNLTEPVSDLEPAFARWVDVEETPFGGTLGADGALYLFDDVGLLREGEAIGESGTLTTGFHRLGTLDPKAFRYLRVKTEGTVGTVSVTAITPDGTEYDAGTIDAGDADELDLGVIEDFPSALEYLALRFTLEGDGTDGPTLLGYQLKALPVPRRQRMIRLPLALFDSERDRNGSPSGTPGSAWTRLQALEALEESNAVVSFEDKVTGETGNAYIEAVEVSRTAAPERGTSFGGTIFLTLRKTS